MPEPLLFSLSLYRADAVQAAVDAYSSFAEFEVEERDSSISVRLSGIPAGSEDELVGSFCNHVLFETILRERAESGGRL
jgi:hypothetical protein